MALTIQEMDLTIKRKPGRRNFNADALSRTPEINLVTGVSTDHVEDSSVTTPSTDAIRESQISDTKLCAMLAYLQEGVLPEDDRNAPKIDLESKQLDVVNGVLWHEDPTRPGQLCVVVPTELRQSLLEEAHQGRFAGHLAKCSTA